jgi:D-alanyl-D-alanine carboxypeptidase
LGLPDTVFNAASMSKHLTAIAVMRLVQEGKVDLDRNVNSYLTTWKIPENQYTVLHKVNATTITLPTCHLAMLQEPLRVALFIEQAATSVGGR